MNTVESRDLGTGRIYHGEYLSAAWSVP
jgi:hypothetical protein